MDFGNTNSVRSGFVYEIDSKEDQTFHKFVQNKIVIVGLPVKNGRGFEIDNTILC